MAHVLQRRRRRGTAARGDHPAGFEDLLAEIAVVFPPDGPPDLDGVDRVSERYGLRMDGDSLPASSSASTSRPPELDG